MQERYCLQMVSCGGNNPSIGDNGNWWIGGQDTGISAQGPAGERGPAGPQGVAGPQGPQGGNAAIGDKAVYPVIFSDADSFLLSSGMALPNAERYNLLLVEICIKDDPIGSRELSTFQLGVWPNSFIAFTDDSALRSKGASKYGYAIVRISEK